MGGGERLGPGELGGDVPPQPDVDNLHMYEDADPQQDPRPGYDGRRYWDPRDPRSEGNPRTDVVDGQAQWTEVPVIDGHRIRFDPRGNFVDVIGPGNKRLAHGVLNKTEPTRIEVAGKVFYVNRDTMTVDQFSDNNNKCERSYAGGAKEQFDKVGEEFVLTARIFADKSYEKFENGKLRETSVNGFITRFDDSGRRTEMTTPQGDKYSFRYGADGKVESYDVSKNDTTGKPQIVERATKGADGNLIVERRQGDGTMKVDDTLKDRKDVIVRADLKLDYLDKDGYGAPDANGRRIKRDDRTVMASARLADGKVVPYPVNPIRSIRYDGNGQQVDYVYSSDSGGSQQGEGLLSYSVRDKAGALVEFGHRIPDIPGTQRRNATGWFEYRATQANPKIPEDQIPNIAKLLAPADTSKIKTRQELQTVQMEMLKNRQELLRTKPLIDYMPQGKETADVTVDQLTGKHYNDYVSGESRVRNERGIEFVSIFDKISGDTFETYPDGNTLRRAWDADSKRHPLDHTTVTFAGADGVPRVELHHSRRDDSFIDINYTADGKTPNEVIVTPPNRKPIRMAPDPANAGSWLEYRLEDGKEWKPTGRAFPMKVDVVTKDSGNTIGGEVLPPGTVIISQGDKRRVITPAGEEFEGKAGSTAKDIAPDKVFLTPPFPRAQEPDVPPSQPRRQQVIPPPGPQPERRPPVRK